MSDLHVLIPTEDRQDGAHTSCGSPVNEPFHRPVTVPAVPVSAPFSC